jgi:hypothetical protein
MVKFLKKFHFYIFIFTFILLLIPLYKDLGRENVNGDQFLWYKRTENFFNSLTTGDFRGTYQQYHPGVLLMYTLRAGQVSFNYFLNNELTFKEINYETAAIYNFYTKFYLVTFNLLLILSSVFILYKITNNKLISGLFCLFLLSEPYMIGNIRNIHMDALSSLITINSLLYFYQGIRVKNSKYIFIAGLFLGLGLLTKSVIISTFGFLFIFAMFYYLYKREKTYIILLLKSFLTSFIVFFLLFPSMWVDPFGTLYDVYYNGVIRVAYGGDENFSHIVNNVSVKDPGLGFYFLVLKYRLSLIHQISILILIFSTIYIMFRKRFQFKDLIKNNPNIMLIVFLFSYSVLFFIGLNLSEKKTDRYLVVIFPALFIITSLIFYETIVKYIKFKKIILGFLISTLIFNTIILLLIHPYYFAFYNPIYGGINKARTEIYLNPGGIGAIELMEFINLQNVSDTDLIGTTQRNEYSFFSKYKIQKLEYSNMKTYKYVILTLQKATNFREKRELKYSIKILGSDYVRIFGY